MVAKWLTQQGYSCWRDVSYLGRWLDLYALHPNGDSLHVELKVVGWQKALEQAAVARPAATRTYVGMWAPYAHRAETPQAVDAFERTNVGYLSINGFCELRRDSQPMAAPFARWVVLPSRPTHRPK